MGRFRRLFIAFYVIALSAFGFFAFRSFDNAAAVYAKEAKSAITNLIIENIDLNAPVSEVSLDGKTLTSPEQIAGAYSNSENKTLLIGHSSTIFKNLKSVNLGEEINYNDKTYTVKHIEIKEKSAIDMREILKTEEKDTIILMTCSGTPLGGQDYSHRLIITAD